jgi:hypothetical protein
MLWPIFLPSSIHALATSMAFWKLLLPCWPDPQWKWIPSSLTPRFMISRNLFYAASIEGTSSPNLLEKIVANCYLFCSWMAILHRIFMSGAFFWILTTSGRVSAVVHWIFFRLAYCRSFSYEMGKLNLNREKNIFRVWLKIW